MAYSSNYNIIKQHIFHPNDPDNHERLELIEEVKGEYVIIGYDKERLVSDADWGYFTDYEEVVKTYYEIIEKYNN